MLETEQTWQPSISPMIALVESGMKTGPLVPKDPISKHKKIGTRLDDPHTSLGEKRDDPQEVFLSYQSI